AGTLRVPWRGGGWHTECACYYLWFHAVLLFLELQRLFHFLDEVSLTGAEIGEETGRLGTWTAQGVADDAAADDRRVVALLVVLREHLGGQVPDLPAA